MSCLACCQLNRIYTLRDPIYLVSWNLLLFQEKFLNRNTTSLDTATWRHFCMLAIKKATSSAGRNFHFGKQTPRQRYPRQPKSSGKRTNTPSNPLRVKASLGKHQACLSIVDIGFLIPEPFCTNVIVLMQECGVSHCVWRLERYNNKISGHVAYVWWTCCMGASR